MKVVITEYALKDLESIKTHYAELELNVVYDNLLAKFKMAMNMISKEPLVGKDGRVRGTKELVVYKSNYIVVYKVQKNTAYIATFMHTSRKYP